MHSHLSEHSFFSIKRIRDLILIALFCMLIIVGSYIIIPLPFTPVPIVLQNFFVLLAALLLGVRRSLLSVALFLVLGITGVPVFSGGSGGIAHLIGPTGGYLLGYACGTYLCAAIVHTRYNNNFVLLWDVVGVFAATLVIYLLGILWIRYSLNIGWGRSLIIGFVPFIGGDVFKAIVAVATAQTLKRFRMHLAAP